VGILPAVEGAPPATRIRVESSCAQGMGHTSPPGWKPRLYGRQDARRHLSVHGEGLGVRGEAFQADFRLSSNVHLHLGLSSFFLVFIPLESGVFCRLIPKRKCEKELVILNAIPRISATKLGPENQL